MDKINLEAKQKYIDVVDVLDFSELSQVLGGNSSKVEEGDVGCFAPLSGGCKASDDQS
ncbi:hypothetical protein [Proteiniphilum sp. UBA5384]|uniref:hypothetical protein n=1 Tax=Proteiniphilum sp. UBA5384 TaxID=1947279 RepID=UPI0025FA484C|nr:hypothetical protein [Proteiniphilum sp. UBA5384]